MRLLITSDIGGIKPSQVRQERSAQLLRQLGEYLERSESISDYILSEFEADAFEVLKAYLNILQYWGLHYEWGEAITPNNEPSLVVLSNSESRLPVKKSDVLFVQGRPFRFLINFRGATLSFDEERQVLVLNSRDHQNGPSAFHAQVI
jgi:hypothetical protein